MEAGRSIELGVRDIWKDVAIASGFGVEGMVLLDLASRVQRDFRVFTLDTEFLFPETYDLMDRVEKRYGIKVERVYSTFTPEEQERQHGAALWSRDPDRCCALRKVEPLKAKLSELNAWITAIRRDQTSVPRVCPKGRMGCEVPPRKDQSYRRLDFGYGLELRRQAQSSLQPAA